MNYEEILKLAPGLKSKREALVAIRVLIEARAMVSHDISSLPGYVDARLGKLQAHYEQKLKEFK